MENTLEELCRLNEEFKSCSDPVRISEIKNEIITLGLKQTNNNSSLQTYSNAAKELKEDLEKLLLKKDIDSIEEYILKYSDLQEKINSFREMLGTNIESSNIDVEVLREILKELKEQ